MNFAPDRRRPQATVHLATDRLILPWHALQNEHSPSALVIPWLAMVAVMLFATFPDFSMYAPGSLSGGVTLVVAPLLQLLFALALIRGTLRCLDFHGASANIGLAIVPLLPLAIAAFTPFRMAEAGWEALGAIAVLRLLVDRRDVWRNSALAGCVLAVLGTFWFTGIWLAVAAAFFLVFQYMRDGRGEPLAAFISGMALGACAIALATFVQQDGIGLVDAAVPASLAASAALSWMLGCRARPPALLSRMTIVLLIAAIALAGPLMTAAPAANLPVLAAGEQVAQVLRQGQWHDATGMILSMTGLWLLAIILRRHELSHSRNARGWRAVLLLSGTMLVLAFFDWRAAVLAQLLAFPVFALLLCDALRVTSRFSNGAMRAAAVCLALLVLTPTGGSLTGSIAKNVAEGRAPMVPEPIQLASTALGVSDLLR